MIKEKPLVSVGVPTFNRPAGLRCVLESIVSQDYENLQIIVSDNCSDKKEVVELMREFARKDKRIQCFRHNRNMGPTPNFNFVLNKAVGDYFIWAADDDEWTDINYISKCVEFLSGNENYSSVCGIAKYYGNGSYLNEGVKMVLESDDPFQRVYDYYMKVEDNSTFYGLYNKKNISGLEMKNVLGGDWIFLANAAFRGKIGLIPDVFFRRNYGGATVSFEKIASTLGISKINGAFPYFMISFNVFKDILCNSKVFGSVDIITRLIMALKASWVIFYKRAFIPWFLKRPSIIVKTAVLLKGVIKRSVRVFRG